MRLGAPRSHLQMQGRWGWDSNPRFYRTPLTQRIYLWKWTLKNVLACLYAYDSRTLELLRVFDGTGGNSSASETRNVSLHAAASM